MARSNDDTFGPVANGRRDRAPSTPIPQDAHRLAARAEQYSDAHAYHEIARRPELTRGMTMGEWNVWTPAAAPLPAA
jgi:hypothetical protein